MTFILYLQRLYCASIISNFIGWRHMSLVTCEFRTDFCPPADGHPPFLIAYVAVHDESTSIDRCAAHDDSNRSRSSN